MGRLGPLACAVLLAACAPDTQAIGVVGSSSEGSTVTGDGSTGSTAAASTSGDPGSSEEDAADAGGLLPKMDMGSADLPGDDGCRDQTFCEPDALSPIVLAGSTPLGDIELDYAFFGVGICGCAQVDFGVQLVWSSDPLAFPKEEDAFDRLLTTVDNVLGPQTADAFLSRDGALDNAPATIELTSIPSDPLDPSAQTRVTGTITIEDVGWSLQGEFDAPLCHGVDFAIPCD